MIQNLIFPIIGGLGLFLFGMELLSDGLKKAAGDRLKKLLEKFTSTPVIGLTFGALVTLLIQSSSATTVMVVGFCNAGLMTLKQAISVIIGANIGTTFTAWLVGFLAVFKITNYALPAVGVGFLLTAIGKTRRHRHWGEVLIGFGCLFLGIHFMKEAFSPLETSTSIRGLFVYFKDYPLLGVFVGTILTMMLQSSSATIALVQILAFEGLLTFDSAVPLILGDNIGTTITAQVAAIRGDRNAKRAAWAHTMFNLLGVAYMMVLVYPGWYAGFIDYIVPGPINKTNIMFHIALSHSVFNVTNAFVFLPLVGFLEKLAIRLVPEQPGELDMSPRYLERNLLSTPPLALEQAMREIVRMFKLAQESTQHAYQGFISQDLGCLKEVTHTEEAIDNLQREITSYLIELSQQPISLEISESLPVLLHVVNDLERIGDHAENLMELAERRIDEKLYFPPDAIRELQRMYVATQSIAEDVMIGLVNNDIESARRALEREEELNRLQLVLNDHHAERLQKGRIHPLAGIVFLDFVDNLERVGDHLTNISQSVLGGFRWGEKIKLDAEE